MRASSVICAASLLGAVIAPEIVVVERIHPFADRDHAGSGGVECDGFDLLAGNARQLHRLPRGLGQRAHVIFVRLRGEVGIFALAVQGIFGDCGSQQSALAVDDRDADAERAEIYACNDGHGRGSWILGVRPI